MERKIIGDPLNRQNRNNHNENYEYLFSLLVDTVNKIKEEINQDVLNQVIEESRVNWLEAVDTIDDLPTEASVGDAVFVTENNKAYRYNGEEWVLFQALDSSVISEFKDEMNSQIQSFMSLYEDLFANQEELTRKKTVEVSETEPEHAEVWFEVVE